MCSSSISFILTPVVVFCVYWLQPSEWFGSFNLPPSRKLWNSNLPPVAANCESNLEKSWPAMNCQLEDSANKMETKNSHNLQFQKLHCPNTVPKNFSYITKQFIANFNNSQFHIMLLKNHSSPKLCTQIFSQLKKKTPETSPVIELSSSIKNECLWQN